MTTCICTNDFTWEYNFTEVINDGEKKYLKGIFKRKRDIKKVSSKKKQEETFSNTTSKKSPDKQMGRPTSSPLRKRSPGRPVAKPTLGTSPKKIPSHTPEELEFPPTKTPSSEPKSILPFYKSILPKKNEIVDVIAAFGSDSSFLPRPLTPPKPRRVSAEETEHVLADLEGNAAEEPQPSSSITSITSSLNNALLDKPFAPITDVAGTRKAEATATLAKLDRPSPFQSVKVISSFPSRVETAEEMFEKQLAVRALNESMGIQSSSNLRKESGYSICFAKADGSIVSRSVTRPSYPGLITQGRGQGVIHQFPSTAFKFSYK